MAYISKLLLLLPHKNAQLLKRGDDDCRNKNWLIDLSVYRACVSFGPRNRSIGAAAKSQVCFCVNECVLCRCTYFNVHIANVLMYMSVIRWYFFLPVLNRWSQTARTQSKGSRGFMGGHSQTLMCIVSNPVWFMILHKCPQEQPASRWENKWGVKWVIWWSIEGSGHSKVIADALQHQQVVTHFFGLEVQDR